MQKASPFKHLLALACALSIMPLNAADPEGPSAAVKEKVDILQEIKAGNIGYHINDQADVKDPADQVFQLKDDGLHVSGRAWGYMFTKKSYHDYHLVIEFKWTGPTWGKRETRARDTGLLIHCHGPVAALGNTWSASIEAQIIEGGMGDILVLSPKLPDGTVVQTSIEAEYELDRDKEKRWKKGAPRQLIKSGRLNWKLRDEDWADVVNYRGKNDPDAPVGEWNRLEVIAKGDTLQYLFNGELVNEAFACKPSSGRVGLQTEAAGFQVRRFELLPLSK